MSQNGTYGVYQLESGTYDLDAPLLLNHPLMIEPAPGQTTPSLVFTEDGDSPLVWDYAVDVAADHVTLQGFSISFSGDRTWDYSSGTAGYTNQASPGEQGVIFVDHTMVNGLAGRVYQDFTASGMTITGPTVYGTGIQDNSYQQNYY